MTNAIFPKVIFTTKRRFNDYSSDDMHYGDISANRLKKEFGLNVISNVVDPYALTMLTPFDNPQARFSSVYGNVRRGVKIGVRECAILLFEEMQRTSLPYSFIGPHRHLINKMLMHFQFSAGVPFQNAQLNAAYLHKLHSVYAPRRTISVLQDNIDLFIDYLNKGFPEEKLCLLTYAIEDSILPKFNSPVDDKINGMGITVHDVYATKIEILHLDVNDCGWKAKVRFTGQDHFGLDVNDIKNKKFRQFQFFKIWFVLQRFNQFGFRPFLTNFEAVIDMGRQR